MPDSPYKTVQWRQLRPVIYDRDRGVCQLCRRPVSTDEYDIDHIVPWLYGGAWFDPSNLRLACRPCNRSRRPERLAARINRMNTQEPSRDW